MLMQFDGTSEGQLELALETAKTAAYKAGKWLKEKRGHAEVISKKARRDGLLDADLAAEQMIIDLLHAEFPTYGILSEETQQEWEYSPYKWVIDPLDGSANFQHGSPIFAIAISLLVENITSLGVIYLPVLDEMFTARRGHGAWLNGQRISVSSIASLDEAMVYVGDFAKDGDRAANAERIAEVAQLANTVGRVRMIGTAATDLAYVACGRAEALIMHSPLPWDIEMGHLLIHEAGGKVTKQRDEDEGDLFICSNGAIHEELTEAIATGKSVTTRDLAGSRA
jgi:myo-inositol-1(or 4)-monophosphatase